MMDMQTGLAHPKATLTRTRASGRTRAPAVGGRGWLTTTCRIRCATTCALCTRKARTAGLRLQDHNRSDYLSDGRVTDRSFAQLLHERIWSPLGCEEDGYVIVDSVGRGRPEARPCALRGD